VYSLFIAFLLPKPIPNRKPKPSKTPKTNRTWHREKGSAFAIGRIPASVQFNGSKS
jgi:hypothetical protein